MKKKKLGIIVGVLVLILLCVLAWLEPFKKTKIAADPPPLFSSDGILYNDAGDVLHNSNDFSLQDRKAGELE